MRGSIVSLAFALLLQQCSLTLTGLPFVCHGFSTLGRRTKQNNHDYRIPPPLVSPPRSAKSRRGRLILSESNENEHEHNHKSEEKDESLDHPESSSSSLDADSPQSTQPPQQQTQPTLQRKKTILDQRPRWEGEKLNGASKPRPLPTVRSCLGQLTQLTRPHNFPGTLVFHMLGIYLALDHVGQTKQFIPLALGDAVMWNVWSCIVLVSSTSMVINDYYDVQLGRDTDPRKSPLVSGALPLYLVRSYLSYLYASALVLSAFVPGAPARLSVVIGLVLTYFYTKYLKPQTWIKNISCALLIALSPLTSGSAALFRSTQNAWSVLEAPQIWRLVAVLFVGFVGREMTMDCQDIDGDVAVGVQTVPARYGTAFTSKVALLCNALVAILSIGFPLWGMLSPEVRSGESWKALVANKFTRRLALASIGSLSILRRGWQAFKTKGKDKTINERSIDEGLISVMFLLGSFV